jgi:hypothetical protein
LLGSFSTFGAAIVDLSFDLGVQNAFCGQSLLPGRLRFHDRGERRKFQAIVDAT